MDYEVNVEIQEKLNTLIKNLATAKRMDTQPVRLAKPSEKKRA